MLQVIDYSEKAIAVIGTERGNAEQLQAMKAMKGKWNRGLTCGQGWVFSKRKSGDQVAKWVAQYNATHTDAPSAPQTPAPTKPQPTPAPSPEPTPQPQPQTIKQAPAPKAVVIPMVDDADELEGAPF